MKFHHNHRHKYSSQNNTQNKSDQNKSNNRIEYLSKNLMCGLCVFVASIIALCVCADYLNGNDATDADDITSVDTSAEASVQTIPRLASSGYIARINNGRLTIYSLSDKGEEYMYALPVRIEDISPEELSRLSDGIYLSDNQSLASFEEDFTS